MKRSRSTLLFVLDILESISLLQAYTEDRDFADFKLNIPLQTEPPIPA
jgi:uncharacterized protein with HEPN domain